MKIQGLTEPSFDEKACPVTIDDANNIYHFDTNEIPYQAKVSASSAFVSGIESFKQQVKQIPFGVAATAGGLTQKVGKSINEYFPDGVSLFNGMVNVKIGDKLIESGKVLSRTANRNLDQLNKIYLKENPRLASAQENVAFDFGSQGANWTTMLLAGPSSGLLMGGLTVAGETQERLQAWKQTHGTVEGYQERQGEDAVWNTANAFVQGTIEKYLGSWAQVKGVKKGWGYVKAIGKNAIQEGFVEEPLQDVVDFYADKFSGFKEDETLAQRLGGSLRGYVIASIFGGAGGYSAALYHRSTGIDAYKEAMKGVIPEEDLERVATKAYEQDAKTMRDVITIELENSSSLRAKRGDVFENMHKAVISAVYAAKKQGAYRDLRTEEDIAQYAKVESDKFADWVLSEANRRNTVIENVLDSSSISFKNGRIVIGMTKGAATIANRQNTTAEVANDMAVLKGEKGTDTAQKEVLADVYARAGIDIQNDTVETAKEKLDAYLNNEKSRDVETQISLLSESEKDRFEQLTTQEGMSSEDALKVINGEAKKEAAETVVLDVRDEVKAMQETEALIAKVNEIKKAKESGKEVDAVKAQNEGRNVIEMNVETFNDPDARAYMERVATKKYKMTKGEFEDLIKYMEEVANTVIEMTKAKKHKRFKDWNENVINRIKKGKGFIPVVSAFKKNGDYPLNFDLSSLCTRREATNNVVKHLINMGYAQQLGSTQLEAIKDILREGDFTTACDICFVESKRLRLLTIANTFAYEWESVRMALGITDDNRVGTPREFTPEQQKILNEMAIKGNKNKDRREAAFNKYIPEERKRVKLNDKDMDSGITSDKMHMIAKLFKQDPSLAGVFDPEWLLSNQGVDWLMKAYVNTDIRSVLSAMFGTATPKPIEGFNVYDPLSWVSIYDNNNKADKLQKVFKIGGFRGQSFSDFNALQAFDYFQFFCDLAIRGLPIHMYTKVPALIKLFGKTGGMFNMSLVPEMVKGVDKEHAGLKPDGKGGWDYAWSKDSFPVDEAFSLRKEYDNAGIIAVGVSDAHILKMLDDPEIDMVIPYHYSGMSLHTRVKTGLNRAEDYTDVQNTGKPKNAPDFSYNQALQELKDPKKAAKAYLDWCDKEENGYTPKFPQFRNHPNYYKLLEDFRGYNNKGEAIIQQAVSMSEIDAKTFSNTLDQILTERETEVERQEHLYDDADVKRKIDRLLSKQRLDGVYRDAMINRLRTALGKENVNSMRQDYFLDQMHKDMIESRGEAEAKRMIEVFRNNDGVVYGYAKDGKIILNENVFNANTPAHEFTHIWSTVARKVNPALWEDGKKLLKQSEVWQAVENDPLYYNIKGNEDAIASEVLARIVGEENEKLIKSVMDRKLKPIKEQNLVTQRIMEWFKKLWGNIRSIFDPYNGKDLTYEEFIHMPLKDLWDETRNVEFNKSLQGESDAYFQAEKTRKKRGSIRFTNDEAFIRLTDTANASTLPHELAHYYLQNTFLYSKSGLASPEYNKFFKTIAEYLGIDDEQEKIEDWQHEKFARSYEQYLLTSKAPEGMETAFREYSKWIKRAYRSLKSRPKYRNEEGKLVQARLTPEITEVFSRLTNEFIARPDIEEMADEVTSVLQDAVEEIENKIAEDIRLAEKATMYPTTQFRETAEAGETGRSSVAYRVLGEEIGYEVKKIEDQMEKARAFVRGNLQAAREVVKGKPAPEGLLNTAVNIAYTEIMQEMGNYKEADMAVRIRSLEQTRRGQEIAMERATTDDALSAEFWTDLALANKARALANSNFNGDMNALQSFIDKKTKELADSVKGASKEDRAKIIQEKLDEISKESGVLFQEDYEDLIDADDFNEILNETQILIEKSLGIKLDDDQIEYIQNNVKQLKAIVKDTISTNGNISIEAFKKIREMHNTIDSYTPSSNLAVWSSIFGRGVMLASIKSPVLNMVSNIENYVTESIVRASTNIATKQTNENIVDAKLQSDYLEWDDKVYKASGYMPSVTQNILGEVPILGEKLLHSQGKGVVRWLGRFAEDTVFKYGLGYFDNRFKALTFSNVVANKATQKAYDEGLSGDQAKQRANELYSDAIMLNPLTEEGAEIRKAGMIAAHETTYTQDSWLAEKALGIRNVLNSGEFKAGDFLVPFVKTPANVLALGLEYSLGGLYTAYHVKDIMRDPTSEVSQKAIRAAVRNGLGVILAMMLAALVDDDDYIPEYDNASPKQRDIARLKNAPFNSIRVGNKWISLDYFGPLAIPMAGILTARSRGSLMGFGQGVVSQALKAPGLKEMTSLIGDIARSTQYNASFENIAKDVASWGVDQAVARTIPAIFTDLGKLIDTYERETGGEMMRRIQAKIPLLREELPIKTDVTGREVRTEPTNILFGARVKTAVDNKVVDEIDRLNKEGQAPTLSDPTRYGKFRDLDSDTKDKVRQEFNKKYGEEIKKLVKSSSYKVKDDSGKKKMLNKVRKKVSEELKRKYLKSSK